IWLSLAHENGTRGRALDTLVSKLSPSELAHARARLGERRAALGMTAPAARTESVPPPPANVAAPTPSPRSPAATDFEREVEATLNRVNDEKNAMAAQLAALESDRRQLSAELAAAWREVDVLKQQVEQARATRPDAELD